MVIRKSRSMVNIIDLDGATELVRAVRKTYPMLNRKEAIEFTNILLKDISRRMSDGQKVAFVINNNGRTELALLNLEVKSKRPVLPQIPATTKAKKG